MTRLLQTCHSESRSWAVLSRAQGPVNTPNIQSHRPVSPVVLLKHLLKRALFCNVNSLRTTLLGLLLNGTYYGTSSQKRKAVEESDCKKELNEGTNTFKVSSSPMSAPWKVWPTQIRTIQPNCSYAPDLLSKPPKLDYRDPKSKAYITSTCETLAGLITLNGNIGQIKAGWPVCTLSAHRWMVKGNMRFRGRGWRKSWQVSLLGPYRSWGLL